MTGPLEIPWLPSRPSKWDEFRPGYSPPAKYEPGICPEFLQVIKDKLDAAPHEWAALAVAFDLFRYCNLHCEDVSEAQSAVRLITGQLTDMAARLNRIGGSDGTA